AFAAPCFDRIRAKPIVGTIGADFLAVIEAGGRSANLFARALHNYALKAGWLIRPGRCIRHSGQQRSTPPRRPQQNYQCGGDPNNLPTSDPITYPARPINGGPIERALPKNGQMGTITTVNE